MNVKDDGSPFKGVAKSPTAGHAELPAESYYCDTIVRRFEQLTGKQARLVSSGDTFETVEVAT